MTKEFLRFWWLSKSRSPMFSKKVGIKILFAFFMLIILLDMLVLGLGARELLLSNYSEYELISRYCGFLLYYFMIELKLRFFLQGIPEMSVGPLLHLPIKRSAIINNFLGRSALTMFNIVPWIMIIPSAIRVLSLEYSTGPIIAFLIFVMSLMVFNTFLILYIKKQIVDNTKVAILIAVAILSIIALELLGVFSFSDWGGGILATLISHPYVMPVFMIFPYVMYRVNFGAFRQKLYLESFKTGKDKYTKDNRLITYFDRFGRLGQIIICELRLIFRNKRPRSVMMSSLIILIYGPLFYLQDMYMGMLGMLIFVGIMMTGMPIVAYGNLMFSWNGGYFDFIMANNMSLREFLTSKYVILIMPSTVLFLLSIPWAFYEPMLLGVNLACWLFNLGTSVYIMMWLGMRSPKRIDLSRGATFNYQGLSAIHFATVFIVILLPEAIWVLFSSFGTGWHGLIIIGLIGVLGIFFWRQALSGLARTFAAKRYEIADSLRSN